MAGPEGRGLSGEHIKLCAEGARATETLRQKDRDANNGARSGVRVVLEGLLFFVWEKYERRNLYVFKTY